MFTKPVPILLVLLLLLSTVPLTEGNAGGKYQHSSGCSCHSNSGSAPSVAITGLPSSYTPQASYALTIAVTGGVSGSDGGFSLDASQGTLSTGLGFAVNVNAAGTSATHSITGSSQRSWAVDWTAPASGSGQSTISVAGLTANGNGQNSGDLWATATYPIPEAGGAANTPPTAGNVILGPNGATTTSTLSVTYTYSDTENDPESGTSIEWFRDGVQLSLTGSTAPPSLTSKHQEWYAIITPSDGQDAGSSVTSNTLIIANSIPVINTPSISPSSPESSDNLSFSVTASDEDQDTLSYETRWMLEGVVVTELDNSQSVPSYATRSGENWSMEVRASDGEALTGWQSSQTVQIGGEIVNTPPTVPSVSITPSNPITADDLSLTYTYMDAENDAEIRHEVEWYLNGVVDAVFKGSGVPSTSTSKAQSWQAKVRVNDGAAWSQWVTSNTAVIGNTAPITSSLDISQTNLTTLETATITFTHTDVDGDAMSNSQIVWMKDGVQISSLDGSTALPSDQTAKGEIWTVQVRAGDGSLLSENVLSKQVQIINTAPLISVELSEDPSVLNPLRVNITTSDVDEDTLSSTIKWYRNGFLEASLINQTTVPTSLLGPGQQWSVEARVSDGTDLGAPVYQSSTVLNLQPTAVIEQITSQSWIDEFVTFDASSSSDLDGRIATYSWTWSDVNGQSGLGTGPTFSFLATASTSVNLVVLDDLGQSATANFALMPTLGTQVTGMQALVTGQTVEMTWAYDGPNATFQIERNGIVIDTVTSTEYEDQPLTSAETIYTVRPVLDGLSLQDGASDSQSVQVNAVVDGATGGASLSGSIVGFLLLLLGAGALGLLVFERRD